MARKHAKIMLEPFHNSHTHEGISRCAVVKIKGESEFGQKHGIPIGRICEAPGGGYTHSYFSSGGRTFSAPKKTKAMAIRGVVKHYKSWIGG